MKVGRTLLAYALNPDRNGSYYARCSDEDRVWFQKTTGWFTSPEIRQQFRGVKFAFYRWLVRNLVW